MTLVADYLEWCKDRNLRPTHITNMRRTFAHLERRYGQTLDTFDEELLHGWYSGLKDTVEPATRGVYLSHVSQFFGWLVKERHRDTDPTLRLARPRLKPRLPRPIADLHLARAVDGADGRTKTWLLLAALCGLRACEISRVRAEDLNIYTGTLLVADGKGGKQRVVPLHPDVTAQLAKSVIPNGFLFPHFRKSGEPVSAETVSQTCNRYLHSVGVGETLHQLRHFYGTALYRTSQDLRLVQEMMGHSSSQTTAGYAAHDPSRAAEYVQRLAIPTSDEAA